MNRNKPDSSRRSGSPKGGSPKGERSSSQQGNRSKGRPGDKGKPPRKARDDSPWRSSKRVASEKKGGHRPKRRGEKAQSPEKPRRRRKSDTITTGKIPYPWAGTLEGVEIITSNAVDKILEDLGLDLPAGARQKLLDHLLLVREINRDINLISRTSENEVLLTSLWESLLPLTNERWRSKTRTLLDLGTGGGFPGICLALAEPNLQVTLLDSRRAKTIALQRMASELNLENVTILHDRVELLPNHLDQTLFDCVTARYVATLKELVPWTEPLLATEGFLLVWKGAEGIKEWKALDLPAWKMIDHKNLVSHRGVLFLQYHGDHSANDQGS